MRLFNPIIVAVWLLPVLMFTAGAPAQSTQPTAATAPPTLKQKTFLTIPGEKWKLSFSDEFDGRAIDAAKWTSGLPWAGDDGSSRHHNPEYASYMTDDNIVLRDGELHLLTKKQDVANPRGKVYHYTQAFIQTDGKFACTYGYIETRVKVPHDAGPGLWPAFWMLSRGWPPEDDIAEFWTGRPLPHTHQGFAFRNRDERQVKWESAHEDAILPGFHTWGMEWGPGYKIFNRDGAVTLRVFGRHVPDVPMYLIFNSGVASKPPPTPATVFPNAFIVDYVRVFARPEEPALHNRGFEGEALAPWAAQQEASVVNNHAHAGRRALRFGAKGGTVQQTLFGLKPQSNYRATLWVDTPGDSEVQLDIKDSDRGAARASLTAANTNGYSQLSVQFTMGAATSAILSVTQTTGRAAAFVDDVAVTAVP